MEPVNVIRHYMAEHYGDDPDDFG